MSKVAFTLVAGLCGVKVLWNLMVPYVLAVRAYRSGSLKGISLMPMVELVLLAASVGLAVPMGAAWPWSPLAILAIGGTIVLGSYIHLVIVGAGAAWLAQVLRRRKSKKGA